MSVFTENKLYQNRKLGMERCILADRIAAEKQLRKDIENKIVPKDIFIIKEIPCPFVKGRIFPYVSRFVLSNLKTQIDVVHVKPVYYLRSDGQWRDMMEAFSWAGNRKLILRQEYFTKGIIDYGYLAWLIKRCALIKGGLVTNFRLPVMLGTVTNFFPDPHVENTSVDGNISRVLVAAGDTWANIRGGAGTDANDSLDELYAPSTQAGTTSNQWQAMSRAMFLFDTSGITDTDTIDSATFNLVALSKVDNDSDSVALVATTPASNTAMVNADFTQCGTTKNATSITIASITADSSTYNAWTLNATGLGNVSKTGVSKFGVRLDKDLADTPIPSWVSSQVTSRVIGFMAEKADTTTDPKLVVTHTAVITFIPQAIII